MIKQFIKRLLYGNRCSSEQYIESLRKKGCKIGKNTTIYAPMNTVIDDTRPFLIEIGDNVEITSGCTILTHGYDWSVLKGCFGDVLGSAGKVTIGNNVFIGVNSTILKGCHIGNNVIIGANSLINRNVPDNVVVAGNPAKVICSVEDYYHKRLAQQLNEAIHLYKCYCERYEVKKPPCEVFYEFFWLFDNEMEDGQIKNPRFHEMMKLGGTEAISYNAYTKKEKLFKSYDDFISYCQKA